MRITKQQPCSNFVQQCEAKGRILPRCFKILFHKERLKIYSVQLYLLSVIFFFRSYLLQCISVTKRNPSKKITRETKKVTAAVKFIFKLAPSPKTLFQLSYFFPFLMLVCRIYKGYIYSSRITQINGVQWAIQQTLDINDILGFPHGYP